MNQEEYHSIAVEREKTYKFLSGLCLNPPSDFLISMIKNGSILSLFQGNEESRSYTELAKFSKEALGMPNLENELTAEHATLFVLPSDSLPHEAIYLDKEKRLGGRVTIGVRQFYERAGAEIHQNSTEMPDHLGIELEFMGFLCKIESELWRSSEITMLQKCIELEKSFLEEHLLKWAFQCCEKIIERATYSFYKAVAYLIMEFIEGEGKYINVLYTKVCNNEGHGI